MKDVLDRINVAYTSVELDQLENGQDLKNVLSRQIKSHAIPQIFIGRLIDNRSSVSLGLRSVTIDCQEFN